jgi:adenylyltransferase/sulfurtransferase
MGNKTLTVREKRRYGKQIMIPEIGIEGQEKLKNAGVLIVGAGGLGCAALQYLAAAGVGKISIIDFGMVDETNMARQTLYGSPDLGKLKSIIAKERLEYLNPLNDYKVINLRLDNNNSHSCLKNYDIILDATDDADTKYIISDACAILNKPMVHGAIYKFEGLISVFNYKNGPSYRDFNPEELRKEDRKTNPATSGFFGVLPGITGTFMANEAIKIITGCGKILSGKILLIDIFKNSFTTFSFKAEKELAMV